MKTKRKLGQFYTTNCDYILQGMFIPDGVSLIEPFAGHGDLIKWSQSNDWELYDLDPKIPNTTQQDTLLNPPDYTDKYIITNPPYLASNKTKEQTAHKKWQQSDLYKCFIKSFIDGNALGGIIIVPLNFFSDRDTTLRKEFFTKYHIESMNIFEEAVFNDTDYTVCSIQFKRGKQTGPIRATVYPSKKSIDIDLDCSTGWRIAGHLFEKVKTDYKIGRLIENKGHTPSTNLTLRAIDGGSMENRIRLEAEQEPYYGKISDRTMASITTNIPIDDEQYVADKFNEQIEQLRTKYHSLFLTNYRNSSKSYARKRISYTLAFNMIKSILKNKETNE